MRSRSRETLTNLALATAATLLCALAAELVLRLIAVGRPSADQRVAETIERYPPAYHGDCAHAEDQAVLGDIIRPTAVPDLLYELKPDLETCFYGAPIRTNGAGVRADREHARPKPAGMHRILLLGDSQTFGQGVPFEETFIDGPSCRSRRPRGRREYPSSTSPTTRGMPAERGTGWCAGNGRSWASWCRAFACPLVRTSASPPRTGT